ncbi:hypothetical protein CVT24_005371 [Panaeolus cyanescens]|uniref:Uncharacterized protein n=1 Tax=Panaeolus cyanescens TaxID=181874 RepID=A0A409Y8V8_9AGAR|nr:hypothetical protein CVT24_005371 [Panaeolus cyanescens]
MSYKPSHRSSQSIGTSLEAPGQDPRQPQRRLTSPASSLNPPSSGRRPSHRPPSPLRNSIVMDTSTGIDPNVDSESDDDDDDKDDWKRSPSPSSSVSNLASSFVQRMNDFVGGIGPKSPSLLSDAEIEAEAQKERDRSRREAEAILMREAQQRKQVEERVLAMIENTRSLPPPPSIPAAAAAPQPPSPSPSQKESTRWWTAAKNKLTPTKDKDKEPLTPAQQVILDAKARDKEKEKGNKGKEKEADRPTTPQGKDSYQSLGSLNLPVPPPTRKPVPASPTSPTPSRPSLTNMPPNLTPSPMRNADSTASSPSREAPPMYAQFNPQGTLDVAGTLLNIAKRFEKLEKWTVGHVRALEERMNDVERWLVDKEKEKEEKEETMSVKESSVKADNERVQKDIEEIREDVTELQGRMGELGREMAKMATAPSRLSSGPKAQVASVSTPIQTTTSSIVQQFTGSNPSTPLHSRLSSASLRDSTSPPMASNKTPSGTRFPYPQGDYTSPPDTFSPPGSPPGSIGLSSRGSRAIPISGLPTTSNGPSSASSYTSAFSIGRTTSPTPLANSPSLARAISPALSGTNSPTGLPAPKGPPRQSSISPTPRKRYTVALGGPIIAPEELSSNSASNTASDSLTRRAPTPKASNGSLHSSDDDVGEETIGKSASKRFVGNMSGLGDYTPGGLSSGASNATPKASTAAKASASTTTSSDPSPMTMRRLRAQSAYGLSSISASSPNTMAGGITNSVAPLKLKTRAKSTERLNEGSSSSSVFGSGGWNKGAAGTGDGMISAVSGTKFVDPLVLRRQSKDSIAMPRPVIGKKVPVGQLVAFFDQDRKQ